jgi:hypothetical protein
MGRCTAPRGSDEVRLRFVRLAAEHRRRHQRRVAPRQLAIDGSAAIHAQLLIMNVARDVRVRLQLDKVIGDYVADNLAVHHHVVTMHVRPYAVLH